MFVGNLENVVGLLAHLAVGIVVDERVVLVDNGAETLHLLLLDALAGFLEAGPEHEHLEFFLVLAVGVGLDGILSAKSMYIWSPARCST